MLLQSLCACIRDQLWQSWLPSCCGMACVYHCCHLCPSPGGPRLCHARDYAFPRPIIILIAQSIMVVGHLCFAVAFRGSLFFGSVLVGFCYGVHWTIMPATASELFGLRNFGMLYNTLTAACPLASLLFSGVIAGYLYDRESQRPNSTLEESLRGLLQLWGAGGWSLPQQGVLFRSLVVWLGGEVKGVQSTQSLHANGSGVVLSRIERWFGTAAAVHGSRGHWRRALLQGSLLDKSPAAQTVVATLVGTPTGNWINGSTATTVLGAVPAGLCAVGHVCARELAEPPVPEVKECFGAHCFRLTFILMAVMCTVGVCLSSVLILRTRPVYISLYGVTAQNLRLVKDEGGQKDSSDTIITQAKDARSSREEAQDKL